jgi:Fe-S cluster assembly protein SufD
MPPEARILRTEAEQSLLDAFDQASLPGDGSVRERRAAAMAQFRRTGLPHRRIEAWHYTDWRSLARQSAPLARAGSGAVAVPQTLAELNPARLVVADGKYRPDLSDTAGLDGVTIGSTAAALSDGDRRIGSLVDDAADPMLALNTALMSDGVVLTVPANAAIARPIEIVHVDSAASAQSSFTRNVVQVGDGANVRIVESHAGTDHAHQSNRLTELRVGARAVVKMARAQSVGGKAFHLASLVARVGEGADFAHTTLNTGAAVARNQSFVDIIGSRANVNICGATVLGGRQHSDTTLTLTHSAPGSTSRVLFKNAVDGSATGAFQGLIIVAQPAQKTDGRMMTRTLLLSEDATFAQKPELEIYADDVQCGHGATSGRIDDALLFYFLSRGIPRIEAERLLLQAFLAEGVEALGDADIASAMEPALEQWLSNR